MDDVCIKFYDKTKPLYLEMDASGIGLGTALLQTRDGTTCPEDIAPDNIILRPIAFASKSLTSSEQRYSNIEREGMGILHGLKKIHHYCFTREVSIITNHKPPVAIFKKDVLSLSQRIQHILLRIHQYWVRIIYKLGSELFTGHCMQGWMQYRCQQMSLNACQWSKYSRQLHKMSIYSG